MSSPRALLNTLLHEFCHHLDSARLSMPQSYHTRGFFWRIDHLYHLALATPPAARRPLRWVKRGSVWAIDWNRLRGRGSAPRADRVCYNDRVLRARVAITVLSFFAALVVAGTPVVPLAAAVAAAERPPALGGEAERTPIVVVEPDAAAAPRRARIERAPGFWKLPPHALTLRLVATPIPTVLARATETARAPVAPPAAPRSCRGPPRT